MRKTILIICTITMLLIGCETRPTEYDHKAKGWVLWASGLVDKANIIVKQNSRTFVVEFEGDLKVEGDDFYNFNDIVEGSYGSLYRWPTGVGYVFMWVSEEESSVAVKSIKGKKIGSPITPPLELEKALAARIKAKTAVKETAPTKYEWYSANSYSPPYHQTVLIKFGDGLTTTAYYAPTKKWKSDINRRKMSGGIALKDVSHWKIIDLE